MKTTFSCRSMPVKNIPKETRPHKKSHTNTQKIKKSEKQPSLFYQIIKFCQSTVLRRSCKKNQTFTWKNYEKVLQIWKLPLPVKFKIKLHHFSRKSFNKSSKKLEQICFCKSQKQIKTSFVWKFMIYSIQDNDLLFLAFNRI